VALPPDLPFKRPVNSYGEILNTCKSKVQQPGRSKTVDSISKEEVYIAWNVRGVIKKRN
jgi:hypothetical protein